MREMAGILDMAALGASEAPADLAFSLKGALRPAVRDDDVEYEGMCRCLVEMLLNKDGMFCELYDKEDKFLGLNRIMVHKILKLIDPKLMDPSDEERAFNYVAPEQPADTSWVEGIERPCEASFFCTFPRKLQLAISPLS